MNLISRCTYTPDCSEGKRFGSKVRIQEDLLQRSDLMPLASLVVSLALSEISAGSNGKASPLAGGLAKPARRHGASGDPTHKSGHLHHGKNSSEPTNRSTTAAINSAEKSTHGSPAVGEASASADLNAARDSHTGRGQHYNTSHMVFAVGCVTVLFLLGVGIFRGLDNHNKSSQARGAW